MSDEALGQIMNLGSRMQLAENKLDRLSRELNEHGVSIATMKEQISLERDMLREIRDYQRKMESAFATHVLDDARSAKKMFIGLATSVFAGLSTLGILIWAILERFQLP